MTLVMLRSKRGRCRKTHPHPAPSNNRGKLLQYKLIRVQCTKKSTRVPESPVLGDSKFRFLFAPFHRGDKFRFLFAPFHRGDSIFRFLFAPFLRGDSNPEYGFSPARIKKKHHTAFTHITRITILLELRIILTVIPRLEAPDFEGEWGKCRLGSSSFRPRSATIRQRRSRQCDLACRTPLGAFWGLKYRRWKVGHLGIVACLVKLLIRAGGPPRSELMHRQLRLQNRTSRHFSMPYETGSLSGARSAGLLLKIQ